MKKTIKKSMLAVGVAAGSALYGATLLAPTTFAAGIGNQVFTDANFYECVDKQYNALNPGILETTTSETVLTDAQLASISALNCDYINTDESYYEATTKITSTAGLNKLIGLKKLS